MSALNLNDLSGPQKELLPGLLTQLTDVDGQGAPKKVKKRKPETVKYWTEEEWTAFMKLVTHPMHRAAFIVAYHRGLRASETQKLQLSDLRMKDERLQVNRCKGSASGELHLCASES